MTEKLRKAATSRLPLLDGQHERDLMHKGFRCIVGIDEVGRGPIAGPVVAAAVVLDPDNLPEGLGDSKAIPAKRREALYDAILKSARVAIAQVPHDEIDRVNIRQATLKAMRQAFAGLNCIPDYALVDGNDPPVLPCTVETVIKGDATIASIAAASIVAKVTRDRLMAQIAEYYPAYRFEHNVGYGTADHLAALAEHGPCPFHRLSFAPLRQGELAL